MDVLLVQTEFFLLKNSCLTFWHPKYEICKLEHGGKDSHCHEQREQGQLQ